MKSSCNIIAHPDYPMTQEIQPLMSLNMYEFTDRNLINDVITGKFTRKTLFTYILNFGQLHYPFLMKLSPIRLTTAMPRFRMLTGVKPLWSWSIFCMSEGPFYLRNQPAAGQTGLYWFLIYPLIHKYSFWCINNRQLLKMSNFFFSHNAFYPIR